MLWAPDIENAAHLCVTEQLAAADANAIDIDLDLSGISWEFFFQDIVKRSKTLAYISVVAAFTCSRMRSRRIRRHGHHHHAGRHCREIDQ